MSAALALQAREYFIQTFMPVLAGKDYTIGYRADDSYFSFAEDFVSGILSLRDLSEAMRLGALGEQVVLISSKAFEQIHFEGYEAASYKEYHIKRMNSSCCSCGPGLRLNSAEAIQNILQGKAGLN